MGDSISGRLVLEGSGVQVGSIEVRGNTVSISVNGQTASYTLPQGTTAVRGDSQPMPSSTPSGDPSAAHGRSGHAGPMVQGFVIRGAPNHIGNGLSTIYPGQSQSAIRSDPSVALAREQIAQAASQGSKHIEVFLPLRLSAPVVRGEMPLAPRAAAEAKDSRPPLEAHKDPATGGVSIRGTGDARAESKGTTSARLPEQVAAALQRPLEQCQISLRQLLAMPNRLGSGEPTSLPASTGAALTNAAAAFFARPAAGTEASLLRALFVAAVVAGQEPGRALAALAALFPSAPKTDLEMLMRYAQSRGATAETLAQLRPATADAKRERKPEEMLLDAPRDKQASGKKASAGRKRVDKLGNGGGGDGRQAYEEPQEDEPDTEEVIS